MRAGGAVNASKDKFPQRERQARLFNGAGNTLRDSNTSKSSTGAVYELVSSGDEEGTDAGQAQRSRDKHTKKQTRSVQPPQPLMTSDRPLRGGVSIIPGESIQDLVGTGKEVVSQSTRPSTNNGQRSRSAYSKPAKSALPTSGIQHGLDNNFFGDKPGPSNTSSRGEKAQQNSRTHLPSFKKVTTTPAPPPQASTSRKPWDEPHPNNVAATSTSSASRAPGPRDSRSQSQYAAPNTNSNARPDASVLSKAGRSLSIKKDRTDHENGARDNNKRIHSQPTLQVALELASASSHRQPSTALSATTNAINEDLRSLSTNSKSTPKGKTTRSTNKGQDTSDVISIDDDGSDPDTIENSDEESRQNLVARARNGSMGQSKGVIPNGNTSQMRKVFETRSNGTVVHEKPPQPQEQASPDDDSLLIQKKERPKAKPSMVSQMTSRTGAAPTLPKKAEQVSSSSAKPTRPKPGQITVGISKISSVNSVKGMARAPKSSSILLVVDKKAHQSFIGFMIPDDSQHSLRDTVIQLPRLTKIVFGKAPDAASAFMQVTVEDAEVDDLKVPLLPCYMLELQASATGVTKGIFNKSFADLVHALEYFSATCEYEVDSTHHNAFNDLMRQTNEILRGYREEKRESDRISARSKSLRQLEKGKSDAIAHLRNPQPKIQFHHGLEDQADEEKAQEVIMSAKAARPRARPSAGHVGAFNAPGKIDSLALPGDAPPKTKATRIEPANYGPTAVEDFFSSGNPGAAASSATGRRTRSTNQERAKKQTPAETDSVVELESVPAKPWSGRLTNEHEIAFVFPREATGAITVENRDINRLAPGEFLNDTLIEYGMLRIFDNLSRKDPRLVDQVHMFSSFFYKKLSTRDRQTKIDPYQTVRKWTNKVNIFEKRYIFIPINEHFHWYLAIIVNPGRMLRPPPPAQAKSDMPKRKTRASQEGSDKINKKAETATTSRFFGKEGKSAKDAAEGTASTSSRNTGDADMLDSQSLSSPELPITDRSRSPSPALLDMEVDRIGDDHSRTSSARSDASSPAPLVTSQSASAKKGKSPPASGLAPGGSGQSRNKMGIDENMQELTLDASSPAENERCYIITLDSLGGSHHAVIKNLKVYLESEAKDKGKLALDATVPMKESDGIYKQIAATVPQQPNMSDCGLYVLHFSDMFLRRQTEIMDALVKQKRQQPSSSEVNRLWQYDDAEKKRESFYDELIAEAKDYKQWRAAKSALGEPEGDIAEGVESSDDDGVDVELVTSSKPKTPEQLAKRKRKARTIPQSEQSESESDAPKVTSKRDASSSLRPATRSDHEPSDTHTSNKAVRDSPTPKLALNAGRSSPIDMQHSPAATCVPAHTGRAEGTELMADIESLIRQAPQPHSTSLTSPQLQAPPRSHVEGPPPSTISGELARISEMTAAASLKTSTSTSTSASTSSSDGESSGSEDSQDELTDASGAGKSKRSASRSQKPAEKAPIRLSPPKLDRSSFDDVPGQTNPFVMVKAIGSSQTAPSAGHLVASGSLSEFEPDLSHYHLQGTAGTTSAHPGTPDASTSMAVDTPVEDTVKAKRPRSEDREPAHRSPSFKQPAGPKRQKPASVATPEEIYVRAAKRSIPQDGDKEPEAGQSVTSNGDIEPFSKKQIRSAPDLRLKPEPLQATESQGTHAGDVTVISDDDDDEPTSENQVSTPSKGPVPAILQQVASSRPSKSASSPNTRRESLGQPPPRSISRPLNLNPLPD